MTKSSGESVKILGCVSLRKSKIGLFNPKKDFVFLHLTDQSRSLGSTCIKGTIKSLPTGDSSVPLMHHDPRDLGLIC